MNYKLVFVLIACLFVGNVNGEELNVTCHKENVNYQCDFKLDVDFKMTAIDFRIQIPEYANVVDTHIGDNFEGAMDNLWISLYSDSDLEGKVELGSIILNSKKKIKGEDIQINDLKIYDKFYNEHKFANKSYIKKNNNILKYLFVFCGIILLSIIIMVCVWRIGVKRNAKK